MQVAIRKPGGKWHRGGRYDYPGDVHCPIGLGLVLMPRMCHRVWLDQTDPADRCRKCFPAADAPETSESATEERG